MTGPVFRFAPSPNGRLHLGHAYSALLNEEMAHRLGGRLLLRIEDIDPVRARPELVRGVFDDLAWLGIRFDGPVRRQSEHMDQYPAAADRLRAAGLLYPCLCSRGEIAAAIEARESQGERPWPRDPDGSPLYPGTCRPGTGQPGMGQERDPDEIARRMARGEPTAWRLDMAAAHRAGLVPSLSWRCFETDGRETSVAADPVRWGDVVLVRKEVAASYHLCVVHDDALQGITHVVRGAEFEAATDLHVLIASLLGIASPAYHHHALIQGPDGAKLSKSRGSLSLAEMRQQGDTADGLRRRLGFAGKR